MAEQRIVHFKGNVQGVGFRYTTCRVAGGFDLTGRVRNLPDGSVECIVEGERKEIDAFLNELRGAMGGYIRDETQQTASARGKYSDFGVAY